VNSAIALALILQLTVPSASYTFVVPSFRDTTIKTRVTRGLQPPRVTTLRLKGPRERSESELPSTGTTSLTHIWQCDRKAWITLFDFNKTYQVFPIHDIDENAEARRKRLLVPPPKPPGPVVTITTDSEDTGERRQMAGYELKRIKTTITVEPAEGAGTAASKTEVDGWYVDLPNLSCLSEERGAQPFVSGWLVRTASGAHDRFEYVKTGNATVGFTVEETSTVRSEGNVVINKTELLEFSDQPLDDSLFEVPPDYTEKPHPVIHKQFPPTKPND
jgi:hypothetical protein